MAGDCPHTAHLEASLKQYHDETIVMSATHESYLKIIDDLKNDLEQISSEVTMVQKECTEQDKSNETKDIDLETSLKELETQNDRLELALKLQTQTKDVAYTELQTKNETLKCQNNTLQHKVFESEQEIRKLRSMLESISAMPRLIPQRALEYGHSHNYCCGELEKKIESLTAKLDKATKQEHFLRVESRKLNEELNESKKKNAKSISQTQRLVALLKSQESHRMNLIAKYELLEQNYEDQAKKLREANAQLDTLSGQFQIMEKRQAEHNMERNLLREEVLSLKEKEACVMGKHKNMEEQFLATQKDLYQAHEVIKEQQNAMQHKEHVHQEEIRRLQVANENVKRKLSDLIETYKKLREEYENQREITKQHELLIESFHKWKNTQTKAEEQTRESLKQYEEHIRTLIEERAKSWDCYNNLHRDYSLLQNELQRLKMCSFSHSNYYSSHNLTNGSIAEYLEVVRRTQRRISEQTSSLREEEPPPSRIDLNTSGKPSEENL